MPINKGVHDCEVFPVPKLREQKAHISIHVFSFKCSFSNVQCPAHTDGLQP